MNNSSVTTKQDSLYSSVVLILLLWLTGLGAAAQFSKIAVPFSLVRDFYPQQGDQIGWLLSIISFTGAILGVVAGSLVARFGSRQMLTLGLATGALISLWQATAPSFGFMLASRLIEGLSHLAIVVAAPALIVRVAPAKLRGAAMALWSTFFGVTFALTAWFGIPVVDQFGLEGLFLAHALFMGVMAVLLAISLRNLPKAASNTLSLSVGGILQQHLTAYRSPFIAAPGIGWLFYTLTFVSLLAILPEKLPEANRYTIAAWMPIASIIVAMGIVPILLRRLEAVAVTVLGFAGGIFVIAMLFADFSLPVICILLFAILGLVQGASFAAIPELNQETENQALSYGVVAQMGNIGNLLGTPLLIAIAGSGGDRTMFVAVIILYIGAIAAHVALDRQRKKAAAQ